MSLRFDFDMANEHVCTLLEFCCMPCGNAVTQNGLVAASLLLVGLVAAKIFSRMENTMSSFPCTCLYRFECRSINGRGHHVRSLMFRFGLISRNNQECPSRKCVEMLKNVSERCRGVLVTNCYSSTH